MITNCCCIRGIVQTNWTLLINLLFICKVLFGLLFQFLRNRRFQVHGIYLLNKMYEPIQKKQIKKLKIIIMSKKQDQSNSPIFAQQKAKAKKSSDLTSQLLRQVNYRKQIEQIHERDKKQKAQRVFKKSSIKQYRQDDQDDYDVPVDGELERGSRMFMQHCSTCHSLEPYSKDSMRGPALGLVFNRKIGSDTDYEGYSDPMIKRMGYWSAGSLYRFMYNPQQFMKGTTCFPTNCGVGLESEQDRADLICFLKQYSYELSKNIKIKQAKRTSYSYMQSQLYADEEMEKIRIQNINTDRK